MSSTTQQTSSAGLIRNILIGAILMVGGFFVPDFAFQHTLAEQGIPLDIGKTVSAIGVLLILFPVVNFFFLKPLVQAIDDRTENLERTFTEAENLRAQMTQMRSDYERRLQETEAQAREQIQAQIKEAQQLRQRLMAEAAERSDEMIRRAQEEIAAERDKVLTDLRVQVVNLTLGATERLLGENMDTEKNRRLIDEFLAKAEVAR